MSNDQRLTEEIHFRTSSQLKKDLQIMAEKKDRKLGDFIRIELTKLVNRWKGISKSTDTE